MLFLLFYVRALVATQLSFIHLEKYNLRGKRQKFAASLTVVNRSQKNPTVQQYTVESSSSTEAAAQKYQLFESSFDVFTRMCAYCSES